MGTKHVMLNIIPQSQDPDITTVPTLCVKTQTTNVSSLGWGPTDGMVLMAPRIHGDPCALSSSCSCFPALALTWDGHEPFWEPNTIFWQCCFLALWSLNQLHARQSRSRKGRKVLPSQQAPLLIQLRADMNRKSLVPAYKSAAEECNSWLT